MGRLHRYRLLLRVLCAFCMDTTDQCLLAMAAMVTQADASRVLSCCLVMPPQLDRRLTERDWRWHLERSYTLTLADGLVQLFFIDTSPFVEDYQTAVWSVNEGKLKLSFCVCVCVSLSCFLRGLTTWP